MKKMKFQTSALLIGFMACSAMLRAQNNNGHWIATWAASAWTTKLEKPAADATFRNVVHVSLGGSTVRVALTNEWGRAPLKIGAAHLAISVGGGNIKAETDHTLTFAGSPQVRIAAGSYVLSDPIAMPIASLSDLYVSVYLPDQTIAMPTCHPVAIAHNFIVGGDHTAQTELEHGQSYPSNCFVKSVQVLADERAATVVAFGDSITDGAYSTLDANNRWPDILAARFQAEKHTANLAVINQGFGGNRILYDGSGPSALARFDRDVLAQPGVKYVVLLEGINDIGQMSRPDSEEAQLTAQELIFGFAQLVIRAHQHGIKVFAATITPNEGVHSATPQGEKVREMFNAWVRTSGVADGVIDFDAAVRDLANPLRLATPNDSGDHIHPSDTGYKAMAQAIDLKLFY